MWWGSSPEEKDTGGGGTSENVPITPVLVPSQSMPSPIQNAGPVPVMVPDVNNLKEQFQQQQHMLTRIKETLKQNESQLTSKEKQVEAYANKLTQIKARSKNSQGKNSVPHPATKSLTKKSSKENLAKLESSDPGKSSTKVAAKGKANELKKCLEENKAKFVQRTGKELSDVKKIESMVEQLKVQVGERDVIIHDLQKNIEQPSSKNKADTLPRRSKHKSEGVSSKSTQTLQTLGTEKSIEVITLENQTYELEATILDLQESLKEKEQIIQARTEAVTLLTQDLSMKGKNTLDNLEETRQEMRSMQNNFVDIENQLKAELSDKDNRILHAEEKSNRLESVNFDLSLKNAELQEKLVNLQTRTFELESDRRLLQESISHQNAESGIDELNRRIEVMKKELDESNKLMIKMKLEHKNKIKTMNKTFEKLKEGSDDKAEILKLTNKVEELESIREKLENKVAELEEEKGNLLLSVLDVDDFKAIEAKLKDQITELEERLKQQSTDLDSHIRVISSLESEKLDLLQSTQDQNILIENLYAKVQSIEAENQLKSESEAALRAKIEELNVALQKLDGSYKDKIEVLKLEHGKEIEMLESYYATKVEGIDRKELEEYRISNELNNIHVEEQIELLIKEKQQLLEKLRNLSGVSSTDSLTFEKMEHSELKDEKEITPTSSVNLEASEAIYLEDKSHEQLDIVRSLQEALNEEKQKVSGYQKRIEELEETIKNIEDAKNKVKAEVEGAGESQKSNTNSKNRIKKMEKELAENKKVVKENGNKIEELNLKLEEKEKLIKDYLEKIEAFEKDDWGRDDWKIESDDFDTIQELQKKCLSLENNLIELNEDCERLRKENIEFVHLLSEEKVKRKKLEAVIDEAAVSSQETEATIANFENLEERIQKIFQINHELEEKVRKLEMREAERNYENNDASGLKSSEDINKDLQEQLERLNIVITSRETEIFRLESLLEDHVRSVENLQRDYKDAQDKLHEKNEKLNEILEELNFKERQLEEITVKSDQLKESVDLANQRTATNEMQLRELLETVREMEGDVSKKEDELQEIKGILAEKNLDMTNLRNRLEEVNSDLTYSYQEHLENMGKCLRDKEAEFDQLLEEKNSLEETYQHCVSEKQDFYNQKMEVQRQYDELRKSLEEKEQIIKELNEMLKTSGNTKPKEKSQEIEELKAKMKKLAANLKKKVQNEKDLQQIVNEKETIISEKGNQIKKLETDIQEITEKWLLEKTEKEQLSNDVSEFRALREDALNRISTFETSNASLTEKVSCLETELSSLQKQKTLEGKEAEAQFQKLSEESNVNREHDQSVILDWEKKFTYVTEMYEKLNDISKDQLIELDERERVIEEKTKQIDEALDKYQELSKEKYELDAQYQEINRNYTEMMLLNENLNSEKLGLYAKLQENLALIESLQMEVTEVQNLLKRKEDELHLTKEQCAALENQNKELNEQLSNREEVLNDLKSQLDRLLENENRLQQMVESLKTENFSLAAALEVSNNENMLLNIELQEYKGRTDKLNEELSRSKENNSNNNENVEYLNAELEKLQLDNKNKTIEMNRLIKDIELLEADLKESTENCGRIEQSHQNKVKELIIENSALINKYDLLVEEKNQLEGKIKEEDQKPKKRKSVTFRTDELEYIKDLKHQIQNYDATLKQANEKVEDLQRELFREKLRNEVTDVVSEAEERAESLKSDSPKQSPNFSENFSERKFDANTFFGNDKTSFFDGNSFFDQKSDGLITQTQEVNEQLNTDFDSLVWDDGWGTDGHLEEQYLSSKVATQEAINQATKNEHEEKCSRLEKELKEIEIEKENILEELRVTQTKYSKIVKKLKEQKVLTDKLQSEVNKMKSNADFGDLDAAIIDELKSQIKGLEMKISDLNKDLDNSKLEKENLLKRIDVLNAGNDRFLEMKERQDNDAQLWETKNKELLKEVAELRQRVDNPTTTDENEVLKENKDLKNQVEGLEWEICELKELLEEKQELLEEKGKEVSSSAEKLLDEKSQLEKKIEELTAAKERLERELQDETKKSSEAIEELQDQVTALATENESLQEILGEMKTKQSQPISKVVSMASESPQASKIFDYFKSSDADLIDIPSEKEKANAELEQRLNEKMEEINLLKKEQEKWSVAERELIANYENLHQNCQLQQSELAQYQTEIQLLREEVEDNHRSIYNLQNEKEEESNILKQNIIELEGTILSKEEEIHSMTFRLEELEKGYNDSKLEIERLLNEENLASEEKVLDSFQQNPSSSLEVELENLNESFKIEKSHLENTILQQKEEIMKLSRKLGENENRFSLLMQEANREALIAEENNEKIQKLQMELDYLRLELSSKSREVEEGQNSNQEFASHLKSQINALEYELVQSSEKKDAEIHELKCELEEKGNYCLRIIEERSLENNFKDEEITKLNRVINDMGVQVETLKSELREKENDIYEISQLLEEEQKQLSELREILVVREKEIEDLKQTLGELHNEISHFRNFEKQMKELRLSQAKQPKSDETVPSTSLEEVELADWSEHEATELNTRLQSDLDTALYMLHQRDVRCDELTFELMQLLQERDMLQLRLSTAIRINEGLRGQVPTASTSHPEIKQESKDLVDQSNDRQGEKIPHLPGEDLHQLAEKLSELQSVGYVRDKTIKDETIQRHKEQMSLLGRISDSELTLTRDVQNPPTVLLNWIRGKTTPKVMHI